MDVSEVFSFSKTSNCIKSVAHREKTLFPINMLVLVGTVKISDRIIREMIEHYIDKKKKESLKSNG